MSIGILLTISVLPATELHEPRARIFELSNASNDLNSEEGLDIEKRNPKKIICTNPEEV